jgi:hypothetical protein
VSFHSFWDVYNQLRDVVDSEFLFQSSEDAVNQEDESSSEVPLGHLRACKCGQDGIPVAKNIECEASCFPFFLPF